MDRSAPRDRRRRARSRRSALSRVLPVLFAPFSRADRTDRRRGAQKSYGLGLYISHEIVVAHCGTIEARSSGMQGTTFTVRLPRGALATESTSARPQRYDLLAQSKGSRA